MRKRFVIIGLATLTLAGCSNPTSPTVTPSQSTTEVRPAHHNIPATFVGAETGPVYWLCATKPRRYVAANGTVTVEEDHYLQTSPCAATLVD